MINAAADPNAKRGHAATDCFFIHSLHSQGVLLHCSGASSEVCSVLVLERTRTCSGSVLVLSKFRQFEVRFWERSSKFRRRFEVGSVQWFRLGPPLIICQGKNVSESIFGTKSWCKKPPATKLPRTSAPSTHYREDDSSQ